MMNEKNKKSPARKPYEKPVLHCFPLRAEEAVLGFCKTASTAGPNIGNCASPSACFSQGS